MRNPMTEANVSIINELKKFLEESSMSTKQSIGYSNSPSAFSRERKLPFRQMVLLLMNGLKRSLNIEIQHFFEHFSDGLPCSKQAFSKQRSQLNPEFFHAWNQLLVSGFYRYYGENVKRWKGMDLWALDGSSVPLPETKDLKQTFGGASNQQGGQVSTTARICVLYDVLNGLSIKGFLHPYHVSEEEVVPSCLSGLSLENKVLLFDRGYPSYLLMYLLMQKGANFIMRVQRNANRAVLDFLASEAGESVIEWRPGYVPLKKLRDMGITQLTPITIRLVKIVLDTGETEVLVTNLYDENSYTKQDLKEVYHLRWGIETYYGYIKEELQLGQFSGIRQICIEQDFAANLFLFNLQSLIEKQTEPYRDSLCEKRKYRYKVNKNSAWASLKERAVNLFLQHDSRSILMELEKLFGNYLEPVRPNRKYPRIKKRRPNVKYYTLTNYKRAI